MKLHHHSHFTDNDTGSSCAMIIMSSHRDESVIQKAGLGFVITQGEGRTKKQLHSLKLIFYFHFCLSWQLARLSCQKLKNFLWWAHKKITSLPGFTWISLLLSIAKPGNPVFIFLFIFLLSFFSMCLSGSSSKTLRSEEGWQWGRFPIVDEHSHNQEPRN